MRGFCAYCSKECHDYDKMVPYEYEPSKFRRFCTAEHKQMYVLMIAKHARKEDER
jgi:hypothetical protein